MIITLVGSSGGAVLVGAAVVLLPPVLWNDWGNKPTHGHCLLTQQESNIPVVTGEFSQLHCFLPHCKMAGDTSIAESLLSLKLNMEIKK